MDDVLRRMLPDDDASVAKRARAAALLRAWAPFPLQARLSRAGYVAALLAWHAACAIAAGLVFVVVLLSANRIGGDEAVTTAFFATAAVLGAVYVLGLVGYAVRRLHDLDRGRAWVFLGFVPIVGLALGAYLLVAPGVDGANAHGDAPPRPIVARIYAPGAGDASGATTPASAASLDAAFDEGRRFAERHQRGS